MILFHIATEFPDGLEQRPLDQR